MGASLPRGAAPQAGPADLPVRQAKILGARRPDAGAGASWRDRGSPGGLGRRPAGCAGRSKLFDGDRELEAGAVRRG